MRCVTLIILLTLFIFNSRWANAQQNKVDSLRRLMALEKEDTRATQESKGIGMTQSRLELDKLLNDREDMIEIVDKKDSDAKSLGTKIIITFKES